LAFLGGLLVAAELLARTELVRSRLLAPSVGTSVRQLDLQLASLAAFVRAGGPVDCLALGSSTVRLGIDPDPLGEALARKSGRGVRCFNFGVEGFKATEVAAIADILVADYRPGLLIYGTTPLDYGTLDGEHRPDGVETAPWVRYRRGHFDAEGWVTAHSAAYRYYLTYRQRADPARWRYLLFLEDRARPSGFLAFEGTPHGNSTMAASRLVQSNDERPSFDLGALGRLAALRARGVEVVVVEMPLPPGASAMFEHGEADYQNFIEQLQAYADRERIPLVRQGATLALPADAWLGPVHLNAKGARLFSDWLGGELGTATARAR
jgi:hypothetical protein